MHPGLPAAQVCLGAGQRFGVERPVAAQGVDGVGKVRPAGVQHTVRRGQLSRRVLLAGKQPDHGAQHHQHRREQQQPGLFFRFWHGTHPLRRRKAPSCRILSYRKRGIPLFALFLDDPRFKNGKRRTDRTGSSRWSSRSCWRWCRASGLPRSRSCRRGTSWPS